MIIASTNTRHSTISQDGIESLGDMFSSDEYGSFMIKERCEMMDCLPLGLLVGNKTTKHFLSFFLQLIQATKRILHLDALTAISLTKIKEKTLANIVVKLVVNLRNIYFGKQILNRCNPFPITKMPQK